MQNLRILNKKETSRIVEMIKSQFGFAEDLDFVFLRSVKNNIYIVNKDVSLIDLKGLRINSIGLYIGEITGNEIRLSIEGSQLIGPHSNKNIIDLDFGQQIDWLKGNDIEASEGDDTFKIMKHKNDFLGCGRQKNNRILNYIPKTRRINLNGVYFLSPS